MEDEMDVMAILDMVSSGKISPDEGVELLEALKASHPQKVRPMRPGIPAGLQIYGPR